MQDRGDTFGKKQEKKQTRYNNEFEIDLPRQRENVFDFGERDQYKHHYPEDNKILDSDGSYPRLDSVQNPYDNSPTVMRVYMNQGSYVTFQQNV
jgi:hypothetical protein